MIWENTIPGVVDSTASRFDESTQYKKSDYVWYAATGVKPKLYKALEDVTGTWNPTKWKEITTTKEFVSRDLVNSRYKNVSEGFENNRFGYKKYEAWYELRPESDHNAMYNKNDIVYYEDTNSAHWWTIINTSDDPCTFKKVVEDYGTIPLSRDWDTGDMIVFEGFVPVDGEIYCGVSEEFNDCYYKYSGGAYIEVNPVELNIEAIKTAGFNVGDLFLADDHGVAKIAKFLTDNPSCEFIDVDLLDVVTCQNEVAKRFEDIAPSEYYYGMPFYKDYQLYALLATTPVYESIAVEGTVDHEFNVAHIGDVYALKLDSIYDIRKLFRGDAYVATQALIFNIWDSRFGLPVPGIVTYEGEFQDIRIVSTPQTSSEFYNNTPGMIINVPQSLHMYDVQWDLTRGGYTFVIDGFSDFPGGGEFPPLCNVGYLKVCNSEDFYIIDKTTYDWDDARIEEEHGGLATTMDFTECRYTVCCENKIGKFLPSGYRFENCEVLFTSMAGEYILSLGTIDRRIDLPFYISNSRINIIADDKIEFQEGSCIEGINSDFSIESNEVVFKDALIVYDLLNSSVHIVASENLVVNNVSGHGNGFFRVNRQMQGNHISISTKWNDTLRNEYLWDGGPALQRNNRLRGVFDNTFYFQHPNRAEVIDIPFDLHLDHPNDNPTHIGNKMYIDCGDDDPELVYHDYPQL